SIFEPIWNRNYIDHIQITVAETLGVEQRGGYYDHAGALRDMVPNHIFQLITLTSMEPPVSFEANAVRDEQAKILQAIQPYTPEDVLNSSVRGQYGAGLIDGNTVPAYRDEPGIETGSTTETYAALKLSIDNWRWAGVPFYIRTGKRLPRKHTTIVIQFKKAPFVLFRDTPVEKLTSNRIVLHIQPDEGITLHFGAKIPGPRVSMGAVDMDFDYSEHFEEKISTGYERLLYDCMIGDATLFQRADMVEASWQIVSSVLDVWDALPARNFPNYDSGTWGPNESDELLGKDGRSWKNDIA
ncbi:MAG: glucose-6-phosphate dehydrogenase, partial [Parachlamydiaceae bacterium]